MANEKFSPEIEDLLASVLNCSPGMIERVFYDFVTQRTLIPDAPEVDDLVPDDIQGVFAIHNFDFTNMETWKEFVTRVTKVESVREQSNNPFLPNWNTKTDDRPTPWLNDCGPLIAQQYKEALTRVFDAASPIGNNLFELIGTPPTEDVTSLIDVLESLEYVSNLVVDGIGESTDENNAMFRWSRALCSLAGLGLEALRHFAERISPMEGDWTHWASCSDEELRNEIIEARKISCYPISLLRADYKDLQQVCADADLSPRWIKASLAVHLFKHVRYYRNFDGNPTLWCAYRGKYVHIAFKEEGTNQTLMDDVNASMRKSICRNLGIRQVRGQNRLMIDAMIDDVLASIHPRDFPKPRDLKDVPELVVPKAVKITPSHELRSDFKWINPGIMVSGLARINLDTGKVLPGVVSGPQAVAMAWPRGSSSVAEEKTWWANLPKVVLPMRPSEILKLLFRNVNDLGYPDGYWALIDAIIIGDLCRDYLAGTPIGNSMINEYPLVIVYPTGHTKETTTNQGKTNYARTIGNVLVQGLPVTHAGKTPSAPSQRAAASPIEEFGCALYDEFQLPESHEHFLSQAGLQTLSTGGTGGPGRANENSKGFSLKHPLLFTCKVSAFPPDIRNRSIPSFMDILTEETRCSSEELAKIMSGIVSNVVRLSALMWIRKSGFVEKASAAKLVQGKMRFDGHFTLATLLTKSGTPDSINEYLTAANQQCDTQHLLADESGLSDNIGISSKFDPIYFFKSASDYTIRQLAEMCEQDQVLCLPAMTHIIENTATRRFSDIVRSFGGKEHAMVLKFSDTVRDGRMVRPDGWKMEWVTKDGNRVISGSGEKPSQRHRECLVLIDTTKIEKTTPTAVKK